MKKGPAKKRNKIPPLSSFTLMFSWLTRTYADTCEVCGRRNTSLCADCKLSGLSTLMNRINTRMQIQAYGYSTPQETDAVVIADALVRLCLKPFAHAEIRQDFKRLTTKKALRAMVNEGCIISKDGQLYLTKKGVRFAIMNCSDFRAGYAPNKQEKQK